LFTDHRNPGFAGEQITFEDIAKFFVRARTPCWQESGYGFRSLHNQWHPVIRDLWRIGDPRTAGDPEVKIKAMLKYLAESRREYDAHNERTTILNRLAGGSSSPQAPMV